MTPDHTRSASWPTDIQSASIESIEGIGMSTDWQDRMKFRPQFGEWFDQIETNARAIKSTPEQYRAMAAQCRNDGLTGLAIQNDITAATLEYDRRLVAAQDAKMHAAIDPDGTLLYFLENYTTALQVAKGGLPQRSLLRTELCKSLCAAFRAEAPAADAAARFQPLMPVRELEAV